MPVFKYFFLFFSHKCNTTLLSAIIVKAYVNGEASRQDSKGEALNYTNKIYNFIGTSTIYLDC